MPRYTVIDPKGITHGDTHLQKGETFEDQDHSAQVRAWSRFGQISKVKDKAKAEDPDAESKAKAEAEEKAAKEKEAAEAKAKAEAESKAKNSGR